MNLQPLPKRNSGMHFQLPDPLVFISEQCTGIMSQVNCQARSKAPGRTHEGLPFLLACLITSVDGIEKKHLHLASPGFPAGNPSGQNLGVIENKGIPGPEEVRDYPKPLLGKRIPGAVHHKQTGVLSPPGIGALGDEIPGQIIGIFRKLVH